MDSLLKLDGVCKEYKSAYGRVRALCESSLDIERGEILGLVGESGSGKSTMANIIVRLIAPDRGRIVFDGADISSLSARKFKKYRREIQMVFQDPYSSINPKKKIGYLLMECLKIHEKGMSDEEIDKKVAESLEEVGLDSSYAKRYPASLSGGQRQRVAIALALILRPKLIVLDEPVSALDVSVEAQILNLLLKLRNKHGLTYLFISHDLNVVSYIADRIAVMYLGSIVELGRTEDILEAMAHPYTKALFAASSDVLATLKGEIPSPMNPPSGCPFHTRCMYAKDRCREEKPSLSLLSDGHFVSCHYPLRGGGGYEDCSDI